MVNDWKIKILTSNGNDITYLNLVTEMDIHDNETVTVRSAFLGISTANDGNWAFDNDKSHILITDSDGNVDSYEIIRLKDKELKVKITKSSVEYVYEFEER